MKIQHYLLVGIAAVPLIAANPGLTAPTGKAAGVPTQMVITVLSPAGESRAGGLEPGDVTVVEGNTPAPVMRMERLAGDLADMQLFVCLDDSTRTSSLGTQIPELKRFVESLPASTQVAVGYIRNGVFPGAQGFTADHQNAAGAIRPPMALPGGNGSPYFGLSELVKHWPSKKATGRRAVLMLTDGVDPYYGAAMLDDPYVDTTVWDAAKEGVTVYAIYLRGAGSGGDWATNIAQSRLMQVTEETGGYAYFQDFTDQVTISPFLQDLQHRLENQYRVTIEALNGKGVQPMKLRSALPGLKIQGPARIYIP